MTNPAPPSPNQRKRNWAILIALIAFVVVVYAITITRLGLSAHGS